MTLPRWASVAGVVGLAELHDVDAVLAERRADRRRGIGFPGLDLELDQPDNFLLLRGHEVLTFLSYCPAPPHATTWPASSPSAVSLNLRDLSKAQFHRCFAAEDGHQHLEFLLFRR